MIRQMEQNCIKLRKEINDLNQGILDITTYYTWMKRLWEELNSLCVSSQCSCVCVCVELKPTFRR